LKAKHIYVRRYGELLIGSDQDGGYFSQEKPAIEFYG